MSGGVTLVRRRLWALRTSLAAARWALCALALSGLAVSLRDLVSPRPLASAVRPHPPEASATEAQWLALRFARAYLGFTADPAARERALAPFLGAAPDPDAGTTAVRSASVAWAQVAAERDRGPERDYTVAVGMRGGPVRYLVVPIAPRAGGLALAHYPALVPAPATRPASSLDGGGAPAPRDRELAVVVSRALGNDLAGSSQNLAADLAPGAAVAPAEPGLRLLAVERIAVQGRGELLATLLASDRAGDRLTLAYHVTVRVVDGRWEVTSIEP